MTPLAWPCHETRVTLSAPISTISGVPCRDPTVMNIDDRALPDLVGRSNPWQKRMTLNPAGAQLTSAV